MVEGGTEISFNLDQKNVKRKSYKQDRQRLKSVLKHTMLYDLNLFMGLRGQISQPIRGQQLPELYCIECILMYLLCLQAIGPGYWRLRATDPRLSCHLSAFLDRHPNGDL